MKRPDHPKISVIGAGAWGTALGMVAAGKGLDVCLWARELEVVNSVNDERENTIFLPGFKVPDSLRATNSFEESLSGADIVIYVVPSQFLRKVVRQTTPHLKEGTIIACASKGVENGTLALMSEVLQDEVPLEFQGTLSFISGPSFAKEVAQKMPTNVTVACENGRISQYIQQAFHRPWFRLYSSFDVIGVELGGALKNVIAIAAGAMEGLGFGYNTRSGVITRGLAEMTRLGVRMGANPLTFQGLSGMGDLVLTCMGPLSRNRTVGERIGRGEKLEDILNMPQVAEGVETSRSAWQLAQRENVDMPLTEQVYRVIHEGKDLRQALDDLASRELRSELG